jgi:ABC-type lipoprotein export system ATPase subunit
MIRIENLTKRYHHRTLFSNLNVSFNEVGLVVISGQSGTGKSSFLKCLNGLTHYDGFIEVDGIALSRLTNLQKLAFRQQKIGALYQHLGLIDDTSIEETLTIASSLKGRGVSIDLETKQLLARFLPMVSLKTSVRHLSFGQRQRLGLIRAMIGKPRLLLLDEPTTGLDEKQKQSIKALILHASQYAHVFLITHDEDWINDQTFLHLKFPFQAPYQTPKPLSAKKFQSGNKQSTLPWTWMIRYQWKTLNKEKGRVLHSTLQSLLFIFMTSLLSLSSIITNEFKIFSSHLIGGQYQYVEENRVPNTTLYSVSSSMLRSFELEKDYRAHIHPYYDKANLEFMNSKSSFIINKNDVEMPLKDFSFHEVNNFEIPSFYSPLTMTDKMMKNYEIILGVLPYHMKGIAQRLHVFPTVEQINLALQHTSLPLHVQVDIEAWGYQNEFVLEIIQIVESDAPMILHSNHEFSSYVFETMMQLPTKDIAEFYDDQPWRIGKTYAVVSLQTNQLIENFFKQDKFHQFHLIKQNMYRTVWMHMLHARFSIQSPPPFLNQRLKLSQSIDGFQFYPQQNLSGFANLMMLSTDTQSLTHIQHELSTMESELDRLALELPSTIKRGHVLLPNLDGIKFVPTDTLLSFHSIILSSKLADSLKVKTSDYVYLSLPTFKKTLRPSPPVMLVVERIDPSLTQLTIKQNPLWLEYHLVSSFGYPSETLHPLGYGVYDEKPIEGIGWKNYQPYKELMQLIKRWEQTIYLFMVALFWFIGMPVLILFYHHFINHIKKTQKIFETLIIQGASFVGITDFASIKLRLLLVELTTIVIVGFITLDGVIHQQLNLLYVAESSYQLPFTQGVVILSFFFILGVVIHNRVKQTLYTMLTINEK